MPIVKLMPSIVSGLMVVGCGGGEDPPVTTDATQALDCEGGGDRFVLEGPVAIESTSLGPITVEGKVAGFSGAAGGGDVFGFSKRHTPFDGDFDALGAHDIAGVHVKYLQFPFNADCSVAGSCHGFIALAGTVTVHELSPRFRATFDLTELFARSDNSDVQGAPLAGAITGCVDSRREP
jgi:hypothetical protein